MILWKDIKSDKNGFLLPDAKNVDQNFVLLNFYNGNIGKEQLSTLTELENMLDNVNNISTK